MKERRIAPAVASVVTGANVGAGTGAYVLDTWDHNQMIKFKVNANYWGP